MTIELGAAEDLVRRGAAAAGMSPEKYVLDLALRDAVARSVEWDRQNPGVAEWIAEESEHAHAEADWQR